MMRLSTKQKREVYSLSSMLLHLIVFIILLISLNSCTAAEAPAINFNEPATAKNIQPGGYDFVLRLANGQRPHPIHTNQNGSSTSVPSGLSASGNMTFTDGQKIFMTYNKGNSASVC